MGASAKSGTPAKTFCGTEEKWAAVVQRDTNADGVFYYSVSTTGVYCRPSCPSRRALRKHVAFHASPRAAEQAGFRPCKRCRPEGPSPAERQAASVEKACRLIESAQEMPMLAELAAAAGLSRFHFHRIFRALTGLTPRGYAAAHRLQRVRAALPHSRTVTEAIFEAGFASGGHFYGSAAQTLGMTPRRFRAGGAGETIRFGIGECSLGSILVAGTKLGICAISLGDDPESLLREFQDRFRNAELIGGDKQFEQLVARVVGFVDTPATGLGLPLDIRGTAFQQRVWQALLQVPSGSAVSYAELARRISVPGAARAVARACAANPLAVAIPCHRVVRSDGSLSGYRWGVARKRALLRRESEPCPGPEGPSGQQRK